MRTRLQLLSVVVLACSLGGCVSSAVSLVGHADSPLDPDAQRLILVTVDNRGGQPSAEPGSTPHGYEALLPYTVSRQARTTAAALARDYHLRTVRQWPIAALKVHCVVFGLPASTDRDALLRRLSADRRVRLAEPLQLFAALADAAAAAPRPAAAQAASLSVPRDAAARLYNDPYFRLQYGFRAIDAQGAQRWSRGEGVTVAIVDTGIDRHHPDLRGQVITGTDFIDAPADSYDIDRHGTGVAGIVGALANNHLGIVGVAPAAHLLSYKACEPVQAGSLEARCNTFTLALALAAAIQAHAQIVNLSLAGPADALLAQLVRYGQRAGMLFVGAVPENGRRDGFPLAVPGVIAVDESGRSLGAPGVLHAPGRDILSLTPGGGYDFVSGSSFAAAHVSGALALLRAQLPHRDGATLVEALRRTSSDAAPGGTGIDICAALQALQPHDSCPRDGRMVAAADAD